ncbi:MAG: septal ring lytic transglycosylase RlpA family protein [Sphingomonadaceae bacterium]
MSTKQLRRLAVVLAIILPSVPGHTETPAVDAPQAVAAQGITGTQQLPDQAVPGATDSATDNSDDASGTDLGTGTASFYGRKFNGRMTASGERFDMTELTAAHRTLPFGSRVRVTNLANGESVVVRINDRGPYHGNRVIDLSRAAATEIGLVGRGSGKVDLELLGS